MANYPRYMIIQNDSLFHVTWQCHNKSWLLKDQWAKKLYYDLLLQYKDRYLVSFFSYCFMSSHPHLTGYCKDKKLFSDFFRVVNSIFAKKINKKLNRKGQVVMDRFKSPVIDTNANHLKVMFYNDLNPKRANIVIHPKEYQWSSFHYYAYGKKDPLITPAPCYLELGNTDEERQKNYLMMVEEILKNDWKEKKPYSSVPYIGNPEWVTQRYNELKTATLNKRKKWREQFKNKFEMKMAQNE